MCSPSCIGLSTLPVSRYTILTLCPAEREYFSAGVAAGRGGLLRSSTDFRHGGFRMLGDLVCDTDDLETARERKQFRRPADSPAFQKMMDSYLSAPFSGNERAVVSKVCRKLLNRIIRPSLAVPHVVALGKRNLLWDLLPDHIKEHVLEVDHAE